MTTPKRYEETAKRIVGVVLYNEDRVEQVSDLVASAAREAQGRVLRLALEKHLPDGPAYLAVLSLKERLESGEDL